MPYWQGGVTFHYWNITYTQGLTAEDNTNVTNHNITLTGLQPSTTYYYRVQSQRSGIVTSKIYNFTTKTSPVKIIGKLLDKNNNPLQAKIIAFQKGTNSIISSIQTDSQGNYNLLIPEGVYDVQFNLTNHFIKLLSVNITQDIINPIKQITPEENKLTVLLDTNYSNKIQVHSQKKPSRIKFNKTTTPSWSYDENRKIININLSVVIAKSGYWKDIQDAVDLVASMGGGNVYIPEGIFYWTNSSFSQNFDNRPTGVIVSGGVNIIGAGADKTILNVTQRALTNALMFGVSGENGKPVRISGIHFIGYVINETENIGGIRIRDTKDFRVDHCIFENFDNTVIITRKQKADYVHRGVIDHNVFDNPYKENMTNPIWGYGIIVIAYYGIEDIIWKPIEEYLGKYEDNVVYIEDNVFHRTRHAIASNEGGYYVARYNTFDSPIPKNFGLVDVHGGSENAGGGRGLEAYNNTLIGAEGYDYSDPFWIRGGGV
jgi:hypothetical protein